MNIILTFSAELGVSVCWRDSIPAASKDYLERVSTNQVFVMESVYAREVGIGLSLCDCTFSLAPNDTRRGLNFFYHLKVKSYHS